MNLKGSESEVEVKDYSKHLWIGFIVLFAAMAGAIVLWGRNEATDVSQVRARHILIAFKTDDPADRARAMEQAKEILQRLKSGESFAKLARQYSNDPGSASRGGDLGFMLKGKFEPAFEQYVWSAPLNQVSDIVRTSFGYHIIEVLQRRLSDADRAGSKPAPTPAPEAAASGSG